MCPQMPRVVVISNHITAVVVVVLAAIEFAWALDVDRDRGTYRGCPAAVTAADCPAADAVNDDVGDN